MRKSLKAPMTGEENGNILHTAYSLINGDRQKDYGAPWDNFGLLAEFFTSYTKKRWGVDIEFKRTDVVNFLTMLKLSRACVAEPTEDTYVDIAGYAGLGGDFAKRQRVPRPVLNANDVPPVVLHDKVSKALQASLETCGHHNGWNCDVEDELHG